MANLIVRNVDERIVCALKSRAAKHNRSAEAEHREILAAALLKSKAKSFAEVLASMPNVGRDADFARTRMTPARMYLVDADVVSEVRKRGKANPGVRRFFARHS